MCVYMVHCSRFHQRLASNIMNIDPSLFDQEVTLESGEQTQLKAILPKGWCLLVLFRHAECMECNLLVHELNTLQNHFAQWSVQVVGVGVGELASLKRLRTRVGIAPDVILCAHPKRELHKQLQLKDSILAAWGPQAIWNTLKGFYQGHIQTSLAFPMGQQSGIILLNPQRKSCWIHRSRFLGDIPSHGIILEQIMLARLEPS